MSAPLQLDALHTFETRTNRGVVPQSANVSLKTLRLAKTERLLHWAIAVPFLISYTTALILWLVYDADPSLPWRSAFSGIHRASAVALIALPILAGLWVRGDARTHLFNIRQAWAWMFSDCIWLWKLLLAAISDGCSLPEKGNLNAAKHLNFMVSLVTYPLYVVTGVLMWATNAGTLSSMLHFSMVVLAAPLIMLHIITATTNSGKSPALQRKIEALVNQRWVMLHHQRWYRHNYDERPRTFVQKR